jgi:hypothetical protein
MVKYRISLAIFIFGLVVSGLTAFPLETEMKVLCALLGIHNAQEYENFSGLYHWIAYVSHGLTETYRKYPFIGYGTDWLAFGHLVIAMFFVKPLLQPSGNLWVLKCGLIACMAIIPLAFLAGEVRQIPVYWRVVDCAFGVFGAIPLLYCLRQAKHLEIRQ